jgi:hypothetical protein
VTSAALPKFGRSFYCHRTTPPPAITADADPYDFTKDYVKLDKEKFKKAFEGNVLDLGVF